jgi:C1A family cysteine protease
MNDVTKKGLALLAVSALFGMGACGEPVNEPAPDATPDNPAFDDGDYPLAGYDETVDDLAPPDGSEPERFDLKFDLTLPPKYEALQEFQSPVRNQASRGVCSIFSTVGLMESLYIMEGTITEPDFSEQFLQWSAKLEAGHFPRSGGSSGRSNLDALNRFGVVTEEVHPYETSGWGTSQDAACTGDDRPTYCYTNGEPSDEIKNSPRYRLPRSKYVSVFPKSLKTYMFKNETPVIIGVDFMYQSWNHGGSKFTVNQENKKMGAVPYPSPQDKEASLEKRAGHSILIVGWDDDIEFPRLDEDGTPLKDTAGNPIYEKGFYIIKNSWGTSGSWGAEHPWGRGYGYISYNYVKDFGRAVSAGLPDESHFPEIQTAADADGDGVIDEVDNCVMTSNPGQEDTDSDGVGNACDNCAAVSNPDQANADGDTLGDACDECPEGTCSDSATYTNDQGVDIPDADDEGIVSEIEVDLDGAITSLVLTVDITHSWVGDLDVLLMAPNGDFAIIKEAGADESNDYKVTVTVEDFNGLPAAGTWQLLVSDGLERDTGRLHSWGLKVDTE